MRPRTLHVAIGALLVAAALSGCFRTSPSASNDLISSKTYTHLTVEIDFAQGHEPNPGSVELLKQRINERLSKPGGVNFVQSGFTASRNSYSTQDLADLEGKQRNHRAEGTTMVLYVLYLNGHHSADTQNEKVLGVQYGRASIAIFEETIAGTGGFLGLGLNTADVEKAVLVHEFGHALGLVNNGLPMVSHHEDASHPKHSSNENSVMYWAVENTFGIGALDRIPNDFDANDVADIRAAGGK